MIYKYLLWTHWGRDKMVTIFANDIFIFFNGNIWLLNDLSLEFVSKVQLNNIPTLFYILTWRPPGDKPFSEPVMASLLTHICVTRPLWINLFLSSSLTCPKDFCETTAGEILTHDTWWDHVASNNLFNIFAWMFCWRVGIKSLSEPMLTCHQWCPVVFSLE